MEPCEKCNLQVSSLMSLVKMGSKVDVNNERQCKTCGNTMHDLFQDALMDRVRRKPRCTCDAEQFKGVHHEMCAQYVRKPKCNCRVLMSLIDFERFSLDNDHHKQCPVYRPTDD